LRFRKSFLLLIFAVCLLACGSFAFAEEEVKVEVIGTDPAELTEAGMVTVTFEISNHSDYELSNLSIVLGEFVYQIPQETIIPVAGSAKIPVAVNVADAQIGLPLVFMVSWNCGGEPYFINKEVIIDRAVEPTITMTRSVSDVHARKGEKLTLTYTLKNESKFDMTEITLIDEQISDKPIRRNDTLRANDSFVIEYTYEMGTGDVVSAPVVTYVVNGKTKTFSAVEPVTLSMVNVQISLDVEQGTPSATGVPFTLTAKNNGNQKVTDLVVKDEQGNLINNSPFSLEPGDSQTLSCTVAPVMGDAVRNVSFSLMGTDDFGDPCSSETTAVFPIYPFVDDSQIQVSIQGLLVSEWTAQTGTVGVKLLIQNNSSVTLTNAVLSETSLGTLQTYATLSNGQTIYEGELMIGSPRNLSFSLHAKDPAGTERLTAEHMLTVAYPETTEEPPVATQVPQQVKPSSGIWSNLITRVLIILGAIMVISFAILLILTILERSHGMHGLSLFEEEDDAFDEMYDEVETTYTDDYGVPDTVPVDEDGVALTSTYLNHKTLYEPSTQRDKAYHRNEYTRPMPSYDEVIQSTLPVQRKYETRPVEVQQRTDSFRRPKDNFDFQESAYSESIWEDKNELDRDAGFEDAFFGTDDVLANDTVDSYSVTVEHEAYDRNFDTVQGPKNITVHRAPRTQTQRRNTIKRVTTYDDRKN